MSRRYRDKPFCEEAVHYLFVCVLFISIAIFSIIWIVLQVELHNKTPFTGCCEEMRCCVYGDYRQVCYHREDNPFLDKYQPVWEVLMYLNNTPGEIVSIFGKCHDIDKYSWKELSKHSIGDCTTCYNCSACREDEEKQYVWSIVDLEIIRDSITSVSIIIIIIAIPSIFYLVLLIYLKYMRIEVRRPNEITQLL